MSKLLLALLILSAPVLSNELNYTKTSKKTKYESTPEYFYNLKNDALCVKAGKIYRGTKNQESDVFKNMEAEINKRKLIDPEHLQWIFKKTLNLGANECEILASLGLPDNINRSVNANNISKQFVYGNIYIYTENGIVTSWQD